MKTSTTLNAVHADIEQVLLGRDRIAARIVELGDAITQDLEALDEEAEIVLVAIMSGAVIFLADLIRQLPQKLRIEVVTVTSYPGKSTESRGPQIHGELAAQYDGRHVVIVDDILDSGGTLKLMRAEIQRRNPLTLRSCVLLRKQRPSAMAVPCEYVGFDIPDVFVVGYGLDYDNYYRNLPDIGCLKERAL